MKECFTQYNNAILAFENLYMSYNEQVGSEDVNTVINGMNLSVYEGEFLVLVGPSGCGKTTILSLMAGILSPTEGKVLMNGEEISGPNWRRGIIFQSPTLYPWYNVYDNIAYGLKMRKYPSKLIDEKVSHYLDLMDLTDYAKAHVYELSGGMKQRVALARVLINEPDVILMDEPFSSLDAFTRKNMQIYIRDLWKKNGWTIVLITHDVDEALEVASRILVLSKNPCEILDEIETNFQKNLTGTSSDDVIRASKEYVHKKRTILNDLKGEIAFGNYEQ